MSEWDMDRFLDGQAGVIETALNELRRGHKESHWMWFVFPQLRGLGRSPTALHFGIASVREAQAYLGHPVLGPRLIQATHLVNAIEHRSLFDIFGSPDDLKFASCMTLFPLAAPVGGKEPFKSALDRYCAGRLDARTLELVEGRD